MLPIWVDRCDDSDDATDSTIDDRDATLVRAIVGIDLGERRIGLAVSDAIGDACAAAEDDRARNVRRRRRSSCFDRRLPSSPTEEEVGSVVVGLPKRLDGSPNPQTPRVENDGGLLSASSHSRRHPGRAAVEPRSRRAAGAAREGLAEAESEARRGGRGGDSAGLSRLAIVRAERERRAVMMKRAFLFLVVAWRARRPLASQARSIDAPASRSKATREPNSSSRSNRAAARARSASGSSTPASSETRRRSARRCGGRGARAVCRRASFASTGR